MQNEAVDKLYDLAPLAARCTDAALLKDWQYLQASDHFYYMGTKFFSNGSHRTYANPYPTPYEAFINYMNVLSDFAQRLRQAVPEENEEVDTLKETIKQQQNTIAQLEKQLVKAGVAAAAKKTTTKKVVAKKETTKKAESLADTEKKKTAKRTTKKSTNK